jgi:hypothetical protein
MKCLALKAIHQVAVFSARRLINIPDVKSWSAYERLVYETCSYAYRDLTLSSSVIFKDEKDNEARPSFN